MQNKWRFWQLSRCKCTEGSIQNRIFRTCKTMLINSMPVVAVEVLHRRWSCHNSLKRNWKTYTIRSCHRCKTIWWGSSRKGDSQYSDNQIWGKSMVGALSLSRANRVLMLPIHSTDKSISFRQLPSNQKSSKGTRLERRVLSSLTCQFTIKHQGQMSRAVHIWCLKERSSRLSHLIKRSTGLEELRLRTDQVVYLQSSRLSSRGHRCSRTTISTRLGTFLQSRVKLKRYWMAKKIVNWRWWN